MTIFPQCNVESDLAMNELLAFAFHGEIIEEPVEELTESRCLPEPILSETFDASIFEDKLTNYSANSNGGNCQSQEMPDWVGSNRCSLISMPCMSSHRCSLSTTSSNFSCFPSTSTTSTSSTSACCDSKIGCLSSCPFYSARNTKNPLPLDFAPSAYTVIFSGRRGSSNAPGNQHLAAVIQQHLKAYSAAPDKPGKSAIVTRVYNIIQEANPLGGAFCKLEGSSWYNVGERSAREKIGCMFREFLHYEYKSSNKSKAERRKKAQKMCKKWTAKVA